MASVYPRHSPIPLGWNDRNDWEHSDSFATIQYSDDTSHTIKILVDISKFGDHVGVDSLKWIIRQSHASRIRFSDDVPPTDPCSTLITISGTLKSIRKALSMFTVIVSPFSGPPDFRRTLKLKLILNKRQFRWIIGFTGKSTILKIEESTRASVSYEASHHTYPLLHPYVKNVKILGNSESVTNCIMEILTVLYSSVESDESSSQIESSRGPSANQASRPATGNGARSSQVQPSQMSPVSHGSISSRISGTLKRTAVSGQSTSASAALSNTQNIAGRSSARTPQAGAVSSADFRAFGELVTSEMQNISTLRQAQLQDEILAAIAKFKKAETKSRLNKSPDDCAICLCRMHPYKSFISGCLHVFCFDCIQEWVKKKSTCPICVREVESVLNIRSQGDYNIHKLPRSRTRNGQVEWSV